MKRFKVGSALPNRSSEPFYISGVFVQMPKIKLLAIALFGLFAFVFIVSDRVSVNVLGRSAGAPPSAPTGLSASDGDYNSKVGLL
jgi:hypothetical protein